MRAKFCWLGLLLVLLTHSKAGEMTFWGPGKIGDARSIAVAPNGEIWVGSSGRIAVFDKGGKFLRYDERVRAQTNSLAFDKSGNLVIGANDGFVAVVVGDKVLRADGFGSYSPWEAIVDDQSFIWATDGGNKQIKKFRREGDLLLLEQTIKSPENEPMERPFSLVFDAQNRLLVSDERKSGLWVFERDGKFVERLMPGEQFWRLRRKGNEIFAVTNNGTAVLNAATHEVLRRLQTPAGYHAAMGFAVDDAGNMYFGHVSAELVRKYSPDGKETQVFGPAYKATITVPETLSSGQAASLPLKLEKIASVAAGEFPPKFDLALQPATLPGEPDLNYSNAESTSPDPEWINRRHAQYAAQQRTLTATQNETVIQTTLPTDVPSNLYQFIVTEANLKAPQSQPVAVLAPGASGNLSLFVPRNRSVFAQSEPIEIAAVLRAKENLIAGKLKFSLARRGDDLSWQSNATSCGEYSVAGGQKAATLSFLATANSLYPGRYVLQAEFNPAPLRGDSGLNQNWRDVWPLEVVSDIAATRFKIMFPEWSAGYTHIWGPFTGKGMRADMEALAQSGVNYYDATILQRAQSAEYNPSGEEAQRAPALMQLAAANPSLPAPEKFVAASPLEIELQEALRNNLPMQRDIWGSHDLPDWSYGYPLSIAMDNRRARIWTQWQREWPSWMGHRYLTLALTDENGAEPKALREKLGITPPTNEELNLARNGASWSAQRGFISDSPLPVAQTTSCVASDASGNLYVTSAGGVLLKYDPQGKLLRQYKAPGSEWIDIAVDKDETVYVADPGQGRIIVVPKDGETKSWPVQNMGSYSPRGVWVDRDGTLLVTDYGKGRVHRYTTDGKPLGDYGAKEILQQSGGVTALKDGTIYVADGARGGLAVFKADGTPMRFLPNVGSHAPGGKMDVTAAPDDTLWVTGWASALHVDRDGKMLGHVGHNTFAVGGLSLPMSVALTPKGNILVADVTTPYAQEFSPGGEPVRLLGTGTLFSDVRLDRQRYAWNDSIIASVWRPIAALEGDDKSTLYAFAKQGEGGWQKLNVEYLSGRDYRITPPQFEGKSTLRLVWATGEVTAEHPLHADFTIELSKTTSAADVQKLRDIVSRQVKWKEAWSRARMGSLVRWTKASDEIATSQGRAPTQNLAPTNYGTTDNLASGIWTPYRREGVVAEANNEGHDHGSFPLHGAWYVARTLDGPKAKPIWASLLQWYWFEPREANTEKKLSPRPLRDTAVLLGTGVSGIGPGMLPTKMTTLQSALMRKLVERLQRLGEATMELEMPGKGGVAVLYSFTQEALDPYNEEHFWTAHAAWYDLLRAHIPTAIVTEDSIAEGALTNRFKAVFLPGIQYPLPEKTIAALEKFQKDGGQVWLDAGTRISIPGAKVLKARYRPFWIQDAYYWVHHGYGIGGYDGNSEYFIMKQGSNARLPAIKAAFGQYSIAGASSDDADVFVQERRGGEGSYVFASNDHYPNEPLYKTHLASQTPAPTKTTFNLQGGAIYDALAMKKVSTGSQSIEFSDAEPARIWAILPHTIEKVSTRASFLEGAVFATIQVLDVQDKVIPAVVPLQVTVTDANKKAWKLWRATDEKGVCRVKIPTGAMAPAGAWRVEAKELLSGKIAIPANATVSTLPAPKLAALDPKVLVFDARAISDWLGAMKNQEVWIALDKEQSTLPSEADKLTQNLKTRGINAKIINIADLPELPLMTEYSLNEEQRATWDKVRAGQAVGLRQRSDHFREVGPSRAIMRPLILLGDPTQNRWLREIESTRITRRTTTQNYPGTGRALIQYVWTPFYDGYDALAISATDVSGVQAGIAGLDKIAQ